MNATILLNQISLEELRNLVKEAIMECLSIKQSQQEPDLNEKSLLSLKDIARIYRVSLVSVHKWRKKGILPPSFKKGGRVYFIREEVIKSLRSRKYEPTK